MTTRACPRFPKCVVTQCLHEACCVTTQLAEIRETGTSRLVAQLDHATITTFMHKDHGHLKSKKYTLARSRSKKIKFVSFWNKISNFLHLLLSIFMYNVKLQQLLNRAIAHELCVDESEVLEFVLVYVCNDVLVRRRQFRFLSCEISVEISDICSWSLWKRNRKKSLKGSYPESHSFHSFDSRGAVNEPSALLKGTSVLEASWRWVVWNNA